MSNSIYKYRLLSRIIIQAETPLAIGSGNGDILSDAKVVRDVNGLPYIPGSSIAGVIRSMVDVSEEEALWGFTGHGSEIIFSEAKILDSYGKVVDGLRSHEEVLNDALLREYIELPVRQHVSIGANGVTTKAGKFDEEIVYAGTLFCFEIEILSADDKNDKFSSLLKALLDSSFRIGGSTRHGFGKIKVKEVKYKAINLEEELPLYLSKSSNLHESNKWWEDVVPIPTKPNNNSSFDSYKLILSPDDFFLFGSGFGDESGEADMTTVYERVVKDGKLQEKTVLIPGTSVKGALRHRVAFHYNKLHHYSFGNLEATTANDSEAVKDLFGCVGDDIRVGNVIISDAYLSDTKPELMTHVKIDRFTGGGVDGALFTEKPEYGRKQDFCIDILVDSCVKHTKNGEIKVKALENSLLDICNGMLPLGGGVNRGNGVFSGTLLKNGEPYES